MVLTPWICKLFFISYSLVSDQVLLQHEYEVKPGNEALHKNKFEFEIETDDITSYDVNDDITSDDVTVQSAGMRT